METLTKQYHLPEEMVEAFSAAEAADYPDYAAEEASAMFTAQYIEVLQDRNAILWIGEGLAEEVLSLLGVTTVDPEDGLEWEPTSDFSSLSSRGKRIVSRIKDLMGWYNPHKVERPRSETGGGRGFTGGHDHD